MTDERPKYPHPDGLRTGRWSVRRMVIASAERFGVRLAEVVMWVAHPIARTDWAASQLRHEHISFPSRIDALNYAIGQARSEQRAAYRHHVSQEQHT